MSEEYFVFEWFLGDSENKITENIQKNNYREYLQENGTIAEEILLACAMNNIEQKKNFFAFNPVELFDHFKGSFVSELKAAFNTYLGKDYLTSENYITINFDILEKIVFSYVYYVCERNIQDADRRTSNDKVIEIINEIFSMALSQSKEDKSNHKYSTNREDFGLFKFRELINAIGESNITNKYISFHKDRKCIALYKKWCGTELTVAFSGNRDCVNQKIADFFNIKHDMYNDYLKIAKSIGANLAATTYCVSRYDYVGDVKKCLIRHDCVKIAIQNNKKDKYYSCCERKIFAFLDNRDKYVYSGKLFVKYPPCSECSLAILYHLVHKEKLFMMKIGLPI